MAEKTEYELTEAEAVVLMVAAQEANAGAGALGGSIGGVAGGRTGGAAGGRFGTRFTKPRTAETTVEVPHGPEAVRERATAVIAESGAVIEDPNATGDGSVWGLVGSGTMNMSPALVRVQVEAADAGGSHVHLRATGREALIKQGIGAKAADRLAEAISQPG